MASTAKGTCPVTTHVLDPLLNHWLALVRTDALNPRAHYAPASTSRQPCSPSMLPAPRSDVALRISPYR